MHQCHVFPTSCERRINGKTNWMWRCYRYVVMGKFNGVFETSPSHRNIYHTCSKDFLDTYEGLYLL